MGEGATYEVVCVANHSGMYSGGHYTATCRVGSSGGWYHFNDEHVSPFTDGDGEVVGREAYVLFLQRCQDRESPNPLAKTQTVTMPELWPHELSAQNSCVVDLFPGRVGPGAAAASQDPRSAILEP